MRSGGPLTALAVAFTVGCTAEPPSFPPDCSQDRCESAGSRDDLLAELEGHADPIAEYLREATDESGALPGDYRELLDGVSDLVGCSAESGASFVVLTNKGFMPKEVFVRCADDPQAASRFFIALPGIDEDSDVQTRQVHMSAWDPEAGRYRHYSTLPDGAGSMGVNVEPSFCLGCHGGPYQLPYWQPLMNDMTNPWSGWNAEPGFSSHLFDEFLDPKTKKAPVYSELADSFSSASDLEPIIRAGIDRVVGARIRGRMEAPDPQDALDLLRPVFCDETINFVSEIHQSGELRSSAIIDGGTRALFRQLRPQESWDWLETTFRLPPPGPDEQPVTLMTVRGESTLQAELSLASRRVLDPSELLRARAIDWSTPVGSNLRCGLFSEGSDRILGGAIDDEIAALGDGATTSDLVPLFYDEILRDYQPGEGADVVAQKAPQSDPVELTVDELGDLLEQRFEDVIAGGRAALYQEATRRACDVAALYPITPIFPDRRCR